MGSEMCIRDRFPVCSLGRLVVSLSLVSRWYFDLNDEFYSRVGGEGVRAARMAGEATDGALPEGVPSAEVRRARATPADGGWVRVRRG